MIAQLEKVRKALQEGSWRGSLEGIMRLVSLCPSTTETVIELGLAGALVGITRFCIHPEEVVRNIPRVGGTKSPDLDAIARARPDLVLMNAEENRREDADALITRGLEIDVSCPKTVGEVPALLRHLGARLGAEPAAEARAGALEDALRALVPVAPFRFAYLVWRHPWMAAGEDTYISDLFARVGGVNALAGARERYPEITLESLGPLKPDLVLLPDEPFPFDERHLAEVAPFVAGAKVRRVSGDDCCWHGVRSLRGVLLVSALARELSSEARRS